MWCLSLSLPDVWCGVSLSLIGLCSLFSNEPLSWCSPPPAGDAAAVVGSDGRREGGSADGGGCDGGRRGREE